MTPWNGAWFKTWRYRIRVALALTSVLMGGGYNALAPDLANAAGSCVAFPPNQEYLSKIDGDYIKLLSKYFDQHGAATPLMSGLTAKRIREHVFAHADSQREKYEAELRFLDRYSRISPEASYELARRLQLHWESEYGLSTLRVRNEAKSAATWGGGIVGLAVFGAMLWKSPQNAPKYFRLVRSLLPLGGLVAGPAGGSAYAALINHERVPVAPAHLLRLGIPETLDDQSFTNQDLYQDALATAASVVASSAFASSWAVVDGAIVLAGAPIPAKVSPHVLIGSLVVGAAAYGVARPSLEAYERHTLIAEVRTRILALQSAMHSGDVYLRFDAADAFVASVLRLSAYLNLPVVQSIATYAEEEVTVGAAYGAQPERLSTELVRIASEREAEIRSIAPFAIGKLHVSLESYMVAQALASGGSVLGLGPRAETALATHRQSLNAYVMEQGEAMGEEGVCYESDQEVALEYAREIRSRLIKDLASGFAKGDIPGDPLLLELSAGAFLEYFNNGELTDFANTLFAELEHGLLQRRLLQPNGG